MTNQSTALVKAAPPAEPFHPENLDQAMHLAKDIAASSIVPERFRGKESDAYIAVLWGRDLGLTPMQSIFGVWIEPRSGRPGLYDQTAAALVLRSPLCKYLRLVESTAVIATWETWRVGNPEAERMSFTIEEAKNAGYLSKDNWRQNPAAMLRARARLHLCRAVYPDILANVYTPDELEEMRDRGALEVSYTEQKMTAPPPPPASSAPPAPSSPPKPRIGLSARAEAIAEETAAKNKTSTRAAAGPPPGSTTPAPPIGPAAGAPSPRANPPADLGYGPQDSGPKTERDRMPTPMRTPKDIPDNWPANPAAAAPLPQDQPVAVSGADMDSHQASAPLVDDAPAPAASEIDYITAEFIAAANLADAKAAWERWVKFDIKHTPEEDVAFVQATAGEMLVRLIDGGPFAELERAFATLGKLRRDIPANMLDEGTRVYKARQERGK